MEEKSDYLNFAISLAKESGEIMKKNLRLGRKIEFKEDNTEITETDLAINDLVISKINEKYPEHNILSEEGSDMKRKTDFVWVCDPLDGTMAFAHGIPTSMFSLALVNNGEPIMGVAYDPFMNRMFYAEKGKGAYLNKDKINVSKNKEIKDALVSLINWGDAPFKITKLYPKLTELGTDLLSAGSVVYVDCLVACGEFDAVIFPSNKSHDSAAIKIIVEEAGGKVTNLFGEEQRYDKVPPNLDEKNANS